MSQSDEREDEAVVASDAARSETRGDSGDMRFLIPVIGIVFAALWWFEGVPVPSLIIAAAVILTAARLGRLTRPKGLPRVSRLPTVIVWPTPGMKAIVEGLPYPCIMTDAQGIVRFANSKAIDRFGQVTRGDPLNFRLRATALNDALERVALFDRPEMTEWQEKIPTECWYEAHLAPVHLQPDPRVALKRPDFVIIVIEDQTERRRTERMRVDFVANASHELRTPLASLTGFIETLQGPAKNDTNAREKFLAIMGQQAARMRRLIDDLLSLSRIEMKAHKRPDTIVDLSEILSDVCAALGPLADENDVVLEEKFPEEPIKVRGDYDELVQVFSNLVENAIKYGASGGRIEVSAVPDLSSAGSWAVSVRDFGPGIAEEHLPRLTERFYRADIASSREKQGTGLGLAIVKHILTRHQARLAIESTVGAGATFTVRIEGEMPTAAASVTFPEPRVAAQGGRARS